MSWFGALVREAFAFLEEQGFESQGEEDQLPQFSHVTYARGPISIRVIWDGRDRACWTVMIRRRRGRQEELGLGHLHPDGESSLMLTGPEDDGHAVRMALERQADVLRGPGRALLDADREAWASLRRRQQEHFRAMAE